MTKELQRTPRRLLRDRLNAVAPAAVVGKGWAVYDESEVVTVYGPLNGEQIAYLTEAEALALVKALPDACGIGAAKDLIHLFACAKREPRVLDQGTFDRLIAEGQALSTQIRKDARGMRDFTADELRQRVR